jgi:hypothetical protein
MADKLRLHGWRVIAVGVLAAALVFDGLFISAATARSAGVRTPTATTGNTYGGLTAQGWPVVVDMKADRRQVVRAVAGLDMTCTSGRSATIPDKYLKVAVKKSGKFSKRFGPSTQRNDDGTTADVQGSFSGRLNQAQTKIAGTWRLIYTEYDAAGAVTDTCDSGSVAWTAKQ